ncbi:hypothetical protein [Caenimonas aquaedulcis]|uniref:Lipoprotein n=1 Tax=Caenimonas aquaedulcis TaxID=2793270 RepID=A0A931H420_9BURK|nr:hypothetical protein [Caenimonas aquaedulcis]MBG9388103.1 hypothetical protein [Caenimonas aquaedulcis]
MKRLLLPALALSGVLALSGCAVVVVTATAASLAVDAAVGAAKLTGKAVGAAVDVVTPSSKE